MTLRQIVEILRRVRAETHPGRKHIGIQWLEFLPVLVFLTVLDAVPYRLRDVFGEILGGLVYYLDDRHRRVALRNLSIAFPEWTEARRKKAAHKSFVNFGRTNCHKDTPYILR